MSLFYPQKNVPSLQHPPALDVSDPEGTSKADKGDTVVALCHFWRIMNDVTTVYYNREGQSERQPLTLQYAEFKFRELLTWTDNCVIFAVDEVPHT
jgi:hypothetical protein